MEHTLQSQLSMVPVPRLATVLRVNLELPHDSSAFQKTAELIVRWWNKKAEPYGSRIAFDSTDYSFSRKRFKAEYAKTLDLFALSMEEPDSDLTLQREWICDFGLRHLDERTHLEVRVSYRQPNNERRRPEPRAPRFLRDILTTVGAVDVDALSADVRVIDVDEAQSFINLLLSPSRHLPVIAVSEENAFVSSADSNSSARSLASSLAKILAGSAHTVHLTAGASWQLSKMFGPEWSVFQGAVRCYNPQMQWTDDKFRHRLWMAKEVQRANATTKNGFLNICGLHVFTQVTAQFEALQLLSSAAVRRQVATDAQIELNLENVARIEIPFTLVEQPLKAKQLSLDVVPTQVLSKTASAKLSADYLSLTLENEELKVALASAISKLSNAEENAAGREAATKDIENQLDQERASRAEDAQTHQEVKEDLLLHQQVLHEFEERDSLLQGGSAEPSEPLKPLWREISSMFQTMQYVATQFRRLEKDSAELADALEQNSALQDDLARLRAKLDSLSIRPAVLSSNDEEHLISRTVFARVLPNLVRKSSLDAALKCFALMFSDRCCVLDSAIESAEESEDFRQVGKAFDLLCKLASEYWEAMRSGGGDVVARGAFGADSYASKESEKISKAGVARRTFIFEGKSYYMEKHLKIGTADNTADTLRVHFEWIDGQKLVIGHCGKHLDF